MRAYEVALTAPWAMTEEWIETVLAIAARDHEATPEALEAYRAQSVRDTENLKVRDRVGIIAIRGPMFRYANLFTEISGATSYATIARDLQAAVDSDAIRAIVLHMDSPGGEVNGVAELAGMIRDATERKRTIAYVGGHGASAAYWLASAASEIVVDPSAVLGSIGVRIAISDDRATRESRGTRRHEFVSSQSPHKDGLDALDTDEGRARVQATADALGQVFVDAVAKYRDVTAETVISDYGRGGVLVGEAAVRAGLADRIGSFETVIAELSAQPEVTMTTTDKAPAVAGISNADHEAAVAAARKAGYDEGLTKGAEDGKSAGAEAERVRIAGIEALSIKGHEALIAEMKADGKTTPEQAAVKLIQAAKAKGDEHLAAMVAAEKEIADKGGLATASTANPAPPAPAKAAVADEDKWKAEGFASKEDYDAFLKADGEGRVKILGHRTAA